jgi:transposase
MQTIGVDLARNVFELAISDGRGKITGRRRLTRAQFERFWINQPVVRVVMEACSGAHHWARMLLGMGSEVVLLPPRYVAPYRRRNKTDRADAEAVLEAYRCAGIKPVTVKSQEQQAIAALHRVRSQRMQTRTARINAIRGLLHEFGITMATGTRRLPVLLAQVMEGSGAQLPVHLRMAVTALWSEVQQLEQRVAELESELERIAAHNAEIQLIRQVPGIGLLTATALYASIGDITAFPSGRHLASWLGITPREYSSGSRRRMGGISKQGDPYLRTLLTHGARAALLLAQRRKKAGLPLTYLEQWVMQKAAEQHPNRAVIALANKMARTAWALWKHQRTFDGNFALKRAA